MGRLRIALLVLFAPPAMAAAGLGAAAALVGQLGRDRPAVDILNHFAPLWLAGGLLALAVALLARSWLRWTLAGWGLLAVAASAALIAPELLRDTGPKAPENAPDQIKIVQLNAWVNNDSRNLAWTWIDSIAPDFVVIEETTPRLRAEAAARPGWHASCDKCEVMILSRRPPIRSGLVRLLGPAPGPLTRAVFRDGRGEFAVIGVHYAWPIDVDDQQYQEEGLASVIALSDPSRTIVTGDFNSAPWSFSRRRWDEKFPVIRRDRALFTWPAVQSGRVGWLGALPFLAIDHVYAGKDWATVKVERGPRVGSDHYPIVMTLAPVARR